MALNHSPKIVTKDLVFAYDMENTKKSWKGKPTTNLIADAGKNCAIEYSGSSYPFVSQNITSQVRSAWSSGSTSFAMQFEGYRDYVAGGSGGGNDGYPVMYIYFSDWSWSSTLSRTGYAWSHAGKTFTMPDPSTKNVYFAIYHMNSGNRGRSYARNFQLEHGNIVTPFVNGTRSNTEAIIDWAGNNTVTASSLTYSSDNTFSFNGSNSSLTGSYTSVVRSTINNPPYSVSCWVHKSSSASGSQVVYDADSTRFNLNFNHYVSGKWSFDFYGGTEVVLSASDDYNDQWANFVVVHRSTGTLEFWVNGEMVDSQANVNSIAANGNNFIIGSRIQGGMPFNGSLSNFTVHDKELSVSEIKQNFNALRGRYGV